MQTQAEYLIGRFGGVVATSRALGHRNATTVQGWKERGTVPVKQFSLMVAGPGRDLDPALTEKEYFEAIDGTPHALSKAEAA